MKEIVPHSTKYSTNEQLKNNFSPNIITAQIGLQVLKAAVSQINAFVCTSEGSLSK